MNKKIPAIYDSLQEIAWLFGSHGLNGECCGDLSFVEYMALKKIHENADISVQGIGNELNFTKSGATRIINRLESKGYALRKNSPIDGRVCCIAITQKGREAVIKIAANFTAYLEDILKESSVDEAGQIENALALLIAAVRKNKPFDTDINNVTGGSCR